MFRKLFATAGVLALLPLLAACTDDEMDDTGTGGSGGSGVGGSGGTGAGSSGGAGGTGAVGGGGSAGVAGGGGVAGAAGSGSVAGDGGGAAGSAGTTSDAGTEGGGSGCNYLVQLGVQVDASISAAQPPAALGGAITDGFYKLTGAKLYGGATGGKFWRTLRFVGSEMKTVERDGSATVDWTSAGTYVVNGTSLKRTDSCPGTAVHDMGFTATSASFVAYESQGGSALVELTYEYTGS